MFKPNIRFAHYVLCKGQRPSRVCVRGCFATMPAVFAPSLMSTQNPGTHAVTASRDENNRTKQRFAELKAKRFFISPEREKFHSTVDRAKEKIYLHLQTACAMET